MKKLEDKLIDGFMTMIAIAVCILIAQCALIAGSCAICGERPMGIDAKLFAYCLLGDMFASLLVTVYWNIKDKLENL